MNVFRDVPIEAVQAYWDARPCNLRHSAKPVGSRAYFQEIDARKARVEPHISQFAQYRHWQGKRVLEIGCGLGTDTTRFAEVGAQVTAVDLSGESLRLAKQRAAQFGYGTVFVQANAEDLSVLGDERFDLVYSFGVIHHTPNPDVAIREMRRHVKADGECRVMVYNRRSWKVWKIVRGRWWAFDRLVAQSSEAEFGCPVTYTYTKKQITDLFWQNGFRVTSISVDHIFPYRVKDYREYRYVKTLPIRFLPKKLFRWFEQRWGWHLMVTARPC